MKSTPSPISILLVEDDPAHAEIVLRNLTHLQERVRCIAHLSDGQQALDYLQREGKHSDPHQFAASRPGAARFALAAGRRLRGAAAHESERSRSATFRSWC